MSFWQAFDTARFSACRYPASMVAEHVVLNADASLLVLD